MKWIACVFEKLGYSCSDRIIDALASFLWSHNSDLYLFRPIVFSWGAVSRGLLRVRHCRLPCGVDVNLLFVLENMIRLLLLTWSAPIVTRFLRLLMDDNLSLLITWSLRPTCHLTLVLCTLIWPIQIFVCSCVGPWLGLRHLSRLDHHIVSLGYVIWKGPDLSFGLLNWLVIYK